MKIEHLFRLMLAIVCIGLCTTACSDDDEVKGNPRLIVNNGRNFVSTNWESHTFQLEIESTAAWTLLKDEDATWFTVDKTSGKSGKSRITVNMKSNPTAPRYSRLAFSFEGITQMFTIQQSAMETDFAASPTYYFYVTFGTMPTLYAGLHLLSHDKESYFAYERLNTFDKTQLPPHATFIDGSDRQNLKNILREKVLEINQKDPNAIFGLQTDDLRARLGYDLFVAQGIDPSRVKVTMLSDGTGTYNNFYNEFGSATEGEQNWKNYQEIIDGLLWDTTSPQLPPQNDEIDSFNWAYYLSTYPDYKLLMQDATLLETDSEFVKEEMKKMKTINITPLKLLQQLSPERQAMFYKISGFDKEHFENLFNQSPKKNLVIIGTNTNAASSPEKQREYVRRIVEQYQSTHDIFFKPHPADSASGSYEEDFPGLTLLPGQMPFEIFVWSLNDEIDIIGGYESTVFLTVPVEKVRFIFESTLDEMIRPLNILFKDAEIEWIN